MRFFLPLYIVFMIAAMLFFGSCEGCIGWKDEIESPRPDTISELSQTVEVEDNDVVLNIYLLFPQYRYIVRHASV
jgi:hypothetical protein